jgi:hypothetical protein
MDSQLCCLELICRYAYIPVEIRRLCLQWPAPMHNVLVTETEQYEIHNNVLITHPEDQYYDV